MSKAVCNASPIVALTSINQLHLLWELFDEIYVPQAVYLEVMYGGDKNAGVCDMQKAVDAGKIESYWSFRNPRIGKAKK